MVARPPFIRDLNKALLLSYLRSCGSASRAAIRKEMGFSKATLNALLRELLALDLVSETRSLSSGAGRPARQISINPEAAYGVAAVLKPGSLEGAWVDFQGRVRGHWRKSLERSSLEAVLEGLSELLAWVKATSGYPERIAGLALAVPGSVDSEGRVRLSVKMPFLERVPLGSLVFERYALPTYVENDAKLAALGEMWAGDAKGLKNFGFLIAKEGLGAGLVLGGRLWRGGRGLAGEIGYLLLETGEGMAFLEEALGIDRASLLSLGSVRDGALQGGLGALLDRYALRLAQAAIALTAVADLEAVFIEVEPRIWLSPLLARARAWVGKTPYAVDLRPSGLAGEAPLYGAIALALGQVHEATLLELWKRR